ncbi:hypothetical protein KXV57_003847 [Aspergillus fumigatus]|uniref:Uncharacterized protein n=1 Tax=Aspergillus fumigatus TaxID=746128 RepID=A0A9P8SP56_ASPFM|nr:hypothetical protein KXV57_003847 [Aspergillus fumigatus]
MLRIAKKITVSIAFSYRQDDNGSSPTKKGDKGGRVSATNIMLAERDAYIAEEEERTGRPSAWNSVYELMQCNVRSCQLNSDWCWEDPKDSKRYKLIEPHIDRLVDYVEKGGKLESHSDVPRDIPDLYIIQLALIAAGPGIKGLHDITIATQILISLRGHPRRPSSGTRDVVLKRRMDLELILEDPNPRFFTDEGIEIGTARRFIRDIPKWDAYVKSKSPPQGTIGGHSYDDYL